MPESGWRPPRVERLDNGLCVGLVERRAAPLVTVALCYRAGAAAEGPAELGVAHFLEHMMFKGSARYTAGEIDRRTEALGGSNNAFTTHDAAVYHFSFAAEHWREALDIEADRMAGLRLDPAEVAAEREVILEELSGVEDDPWDSLELAVDRAFYGAHPYGRPVLGSRSTLREIGCDQLGRFHGRHYQPGNAVLVAAGDLGAELFDEVERRFGRLDGRLDRGEAPAAAWDGPARRRVVRRRGEVRRLLAAVAAPPASDPDHALLRLLLTVLAGGRASRLYRRLVEGRELCSSVGAELSESVGAGAATLACELMPDADPDEVEELVAGELGRLADGVADDELHRAQRLLLADWAFAQESSAGQAVAAALALGLFDGEQPARQLRQIRAARAADLVRVAARFVGSGAPAVVGWSLAAAEPGR